jgi:hypothetical protein
VVIVTVYTVLTVRLASGVKVATAPEQLTEPATAVALGAAVTVKVVAVRVEHSIDSLKFAVRTWATGTPVAEATGTVAVTVGGGVIVVKVHT